MEEVKNNTGQSLGIAALITAIITFVLAVIPCVGLIAIIPGIIAIILASVGLSQASKNNSSRGVLVASLIIGIIASMISISQVFVATKIAQKADKWPNHLNNIFNDVQDNVVINTSSDKKDQEKKLEELESGNTKKNDSIPKKK